MPVFTATRYDSHPTPAKPRTSLKPSSTPRTSLAGRLPTFLVRLRRSRVKSCETLTTESRGSPDCAAVTATFPGASAPAMLAVMIATMTVLMRLLLNASD